MTSKLQSAEIAAQNSILGIANGRKNNVLTRILNGEDEGTLFSQKTNKFQRKNG